MEKIPEKWFIIRNVNNHEILNNWEMNIKKRSTAYLTCEAYFFPDKCYTDDPISIKGYTEITIEQFKKYVLKEEENRVEELTSF